MSCSQPLPQLLVELVDGDCQTLKKLHGKNGCWRAEDIWRPLMFQKLNERKMRCSGLFNQPNSRAGLTCQTRRNRWRTQVAWPNNYIIIPCAPGNFSNLCPQHGSEWFFCDTFGTSYRINRAPGDPRALFPRQQGSPGKARLRYLRLEIFSQTLLQSVHHLSDDAVQDPRRPKSGFNMRTHHSMQWLAGDKVDVTDKSI
jgi:hypothetical protein